MRWQICLMINLLSVPFIYSIVIGTTDSEPFDLGLDTIRLDGISTTFNPAMLNKVSVINDFTTPSSDASIVSNQQSDNLQASYVDTVGGEKLDGDVGSGVSPGGVSSPGLGPLLIPGLMRLQPENSNSSPKKQSGANNIVNFRGHNLLSPEDLLQDELIDAVPDDNGEPCPKWKFQNRQRPTCDSGYYADIEYAYKEGEVQLYDLWLFIEPEIGTYNHLE